MKPSPVVKKPARTKLLNTELELEQLSPDSRRQAACVLEVLAGLRSPEQAAEGLSVSLPTYYNLETRALRGLIHGCSPSPPGRTMCLLRQIRLLEEKSAAMEQQVSRYQALLRNARRSAGLLPPVQSKPKPGAKRRSKKPAIRALRAIETLQRGEAAVPSPSPVEEAATSPVL